MDAIVKELDIGQLIGLMMPMKKKQRHLLLSALSAGMGYGSVKQLSELTGVVRDTIIKGKREIKELPADASARPAAGSLPRIRTEGGGRKRAVSSSTEAEAEIERLAEINISGSPETPLCWTTKSLRHISEKLAEKGIHSSHVTVGSILRTMGFRLQQKTKHAESGDPGADRDEQFKFINEQAQKFMGESQPVISVDTEKHVVLGTDGNGGKEQCLKEPPTRVVVHDVGTLKANPSETCGPAPKTDLVSAASALIAENLLSAASADGGLIWEYNGIRAPRS